MKQVGEGAVEKKNLRLESRSRRGEVCLRTNLFICKGREKETLSGSFRTGWKKKERSSTQEREGESKQI